MMKYIVSILLVLIISCSDNNPSEKDVAHLYVDILVVEETYKTEPDSMQIALDSLYDFHKMNKSEYLAALEKYGYSEETWNEFFSFAEEYLDTLKAIENRKDK